MFAELTAAGLYTGVHRYTFDNAEDKKYLLFDMTHSVEEVHLSSTHMWSCLFLPNSLCRKLQ